MQANDENQRRTNAPLSYLDAQGRYRADQAPPDPPIAGDETATLLGFLERQRATFAWKCGGLDAAGLRVTVGSSAMSLGGLLKHMARFEDDMTTEWLQGHAQLAPWSSVDWATDPAWDWRTAAADSPEELYKRWQTAVDRSRALFAAALANDGEAREGQSSEVRPDGLPSLGYILVNMIEEYARHNGHADLLREAVDGLVGHDPPR